MGTYITHEGLPFHGALEKIRIRSCRVADLSLPGFDEKQLLEITRDGTAKLTQKTPEGTKKAKTRISQADTDYIFAASSEESTSDSSTSTASSAADSTTAEPDIQFDESFQPQTIADNDTCTIILQSVGYDDDYGYYWTVDFQNKTDDKTLCAITSSSSLNGIPADTSWFPEIGPGVKTTEVVSWDKAGLEIYGVKPQDIDTVKLHIDVYDEAEWDVANRDDPVDDDFVIYPKGEENATEPKHEIQPTDIVLFDNNACSMVICGFYSDSFMGYTAKAYCQNKTDDRIDVILDKGSINGFECTPEGTTLLEPHSNAYIDIRWQEYAETYAENGNDPTSITEIVMPVFVRKDTGNNTVYIDATYSIDPQARTATPIVNPQ